MQPRSFLSRTEVIQPDALYSALYKGQLPVRVDCDVHLEDLIKILDLVSSDQNLAYSKAY